MAVSLGMQLQQSQRLVMTPHLKQALLVLQLPTLQLCDYLEQQLQANPALELADRNDEDEHEESDVAAEPPAEDSGQALADWLEDLASDPAEGLGFATGREPQGARPTPDVWNRATPETLPAHLQEQVAVAGWSDRDKACVRYLIGNLDDNGYLTVPLTLIAADLGLAPAEGERLLRLLQQLDPAGVGARDLRECLLIQLQRQRAADPLVYELVESHLADLAAGRWTALARPLGVTPAALERARECIRSLEPKPGRSFAAGPELTTIIPDAVIERVGADYVVIMNDQPVPRLVLSPTYRQALREADGPVRRYAEARLQEGLWFLRALEQRRLTVYRVVEAVARWQRGYLDKGPEALRPLTLRTIGEELSLHESTVSRAVAGKYVQTPRGVQPLSFFFASGVEGPGGEGISSTSVKRRIQRLVGAEDPRRPLADDAICDMLRREGIALSRRTVAKYRQELGIPASGQRRQLA